jgi:hypothetical protein
MLTKAKIKTPFIVSKVEMVNGWRESARNQAMKQKN